LQLPQSLCIGTSFACASSLFYVYWLSWSFDLILSPSSLLLLAVTLHLIHTLSTLHCTSSARLPYNLTHVKKHNITWYTINIVESEEDWCILLLQREVIYQLLWHHVKNVCGSRTPLHEHNIAIAIVFVIFSGSISRWYSLACSFSISYVIWSSTPRRQRRRRHAQSLCHEDQCRIVIFIVVCVDMCTPISLYVFVFGVDYAWMCVVVCVCLKSVSDYNHV
jgi:hypothetical protein